MIFEELSSRLQKKLEFAAQQMVYLNENQTLADLIAEIQSESFSEGFRHAIKTLQNNAERIGYNHD